MHNLLYNISQVLGITILHSLWQGLLIFIALRLFLLVKPATPSVIKYWASYVALCITLGWFIVTLFNELGHYQWLSTTAVQVTPLTVPGIIHQVNAPANKLYFTIAQYMPYLTMLYVIGLVFNTIKLSMAWNNIYRIKQNSSEAGFEEMVSRLSQQLNIEKFVKAAFSEWVDVPCVTGFIKPVILLPVSISTNLSAEEIEAILLHELAHVKRNDYLLNFIQQVIGILLFFNPFARLITKIINQERENCCDDTVVQLTRNPLIYAQALIKLEESRQRHLRLAMAATSRKYYLLTRIDRIMKAKKPIVNTKHLALALVMFIGSIGSIAWLNPEIKNGRIVSKHASQAIHKLTAIVQKAIAGEKPAPKTQQPANTSALIKTGTLKDTLSNSSYIPPATKDTFDFTAMKKLYTSTEWERLNKELILTRDSLHTFERNMPESAQLDKAQKALDSATKSKSNNYYYQKLGLQIVKDAKTKYENSSEIKQKQAEYKRLSIKIFNILVNDPDEKNYQKDMERRRDSLTNAIGPNSPGSNQLKWSLLERAENIQSELIQQKIFNRPDVKPINDSLNAARHALYEGPAWEEYNKAMNDPDRKEKVLMEMNDPDLVKYKAAVSTLRKKIRDNPEYKKYSERIAEYTRKYNELINKLHWE